MYKIYRKGFLTFIKQQNPLNNNKFQCINGESQTFKVQNSILYRLPQSQLRKFATMPCPVQNLQNQNTRNVIQNAKNLRATLKINEKKACNRCPLAQKCPHQGVTGNLKVNKHFQDLVTTMQHWSDITQYQEPKQSTFIGLIAGCHLIDSLQSICTSLPQFGQEIEQFNHLWISYTKQKEKILENQQELDSKKIKKRQYKERIQINSPKRKYIENQEENNAMLQSLNKRLYDEDKGKKLKTTKSAKNQFSKQERLIKKNEQFSQKPNWQKDIEYQMPRKDRNQFNRNFREGFRSVGNEARRTDGRKQSNQRNQRYSYENRRNEGKFDRSDRYKNQSQRYDEKPYRSERRAQRQKFDNRRNPGKYSRQNQWSDNVKQNKQYERKRFTQKSHDNYDYGKKSKKFQEFRENTRERGNNKNNERTRKPQKNNQIDHIYEPRIRTYQKKFQRKEERYEKNNEDKQIPFIKKFEVNEHQVHNQLRRPQIQQTNNMNQRRSGRRVIRP